MNPLSPPYLGSAGGGVSGLTSVTSGTALADNVIVRGDGTTGIQGSGLKITDADILSFGTAAGSTGFKSQTAHSIGLLDSEGANETLRLNKGGGATDGIELAANSNIRWPIGSSDVGLNRETTSVLRVSDGGSGRAWLQVLGDKRVPSGGQTVTNSTTLTDSSHLTVAVASGRTYRFRACLHFTTINTSGAKVAIDGTATHTNIIYDVIFHGISTPAFLTSGRGTAKGTGVGVTASGTSCVCVIEGTTTINAGGTLLVQFAQNAETGAAESAILLQGSSFTVVDVA